MVNELSNFVEQVNSKRSHPLVIKLMGREGKWVLSSAKTGTRLIYRLSVIKNAHKRLLVSGRYNEVAGFLQGTLTGLKLAGK
jgi:hypothetical protein